MQAWMWVQGKRSSSEMRKKCVLLLSKILNSAELLLGVVWNSIRAVLCCAEEGREGKLSESIRCWQYVQDSLWDASFWIWTRFKTSEVDTACHLSQNDLLWTSHASIFPLILTWFWRRARQIWLVVCVCLYVVLSVVLKKTKSAGESLSLFLAGTKNEASGRKSVARRFTHKGKGFTPKIQPLNAQLYLSLVLINSCFCEHPDGYIQYKKYLQYL